MIAKMAMAEPPNIEKTAISREVKRVLGLDLHSWEQLMLFSLGIAGLIAVAVFITTASVVILQRHETAEAKRELDRYKIEAGKDVAEAKAVGETARADVEKAHAEIAKANVERLKLEERLASAETQNLDMRAKMASRRITKEQHDILVAELAKSPQPFDLALMSDPESVLLANDILQTFSDAKWTVGQKELPMGEIWTGLVLFQTDDPAGTQIFHALTNAGIAFSIGDNDHKRPKATVLVGNKPPAF